MKTITSTGTARSRLTLGHRSLAVRLSSAVGVFCCVALASLHAAFPTYQQLMTFGEVLTGRYLYAGLAQGTDGAFYGTTQFGGAYGYGTVFKLNSDGGGFSVLKDDFDFSSGGYPNVG